MDRAGHRHVSTDRCCSAMANRFPKRNEGKDLLVVHWERHIRKIKRFILSSFPDGTEVTFNCIDNVVLGEKLTWVIICADGSWIGRSLSCGE